MHRPCQVFRRLSSVVLLALAGCSAAVPGPSVIRRVYVEAVAGSPSPGPAVLDDTIHDASVRALQTLGYVAAAESGEADAVLRAVWLGEASTGEHPEGRVTLRMSLVVRDGKVMKTLDIISDVPARFLTRERIADRIRAQLGNSGL